MQPLIMPIANKITLVEEVATTYLIVPTYTFFQHQIKIAIHICNSFDKTFTREIFL